MVKEMKKKKRNTRRYKMLTKDGRNFNDIIKGHEATKKTYIKKRK